MGAEAGAEVAGVAQQVLSVSRQVDRVDLLVGVPVRGLAVPQGPGQGVDRAADLVQPGSPVREDAAGRPLGRRHLGVQQHIVQQPPLGSAGPHAPGGILGSAAAEPRGPVRGRCDAVVVAVGGGVAKREVIPKRRDRVAIEPFIEVLQPWVGVDGCVPARVLQHVHEVGLGVPAVPQPRPGIGRPAVEHPVRGDVGVELPAVVGARGADLRAVPLVDGPHSAGAGVVQRVGGGGGPVPA